MHMLVVSEEEKKGEKYKIVTTVVPARVSFVGWEIHVIFFYKHYTELPTIMFFPELFCFFLPIREFTDTTCARADKGHLYKKGKTHQRWILDMRSWKLCIIFIYAPTVHSKIRRWKYSFQEGKQKVFMKHI